MTDLLNAELLEKEAGKLIRKSRQDVNRQKQNCFLIQANPIQFFLMVNEMHCHMYNSVNVINKVSVIVEWMVLEIHCF